MHNKNILIIEADKTERRYWSDLWAYRGLFLILAWRDIAVRYKQTAIGVAWAVLRPFLTMVVFTLLFGKLAKLPSEGDAPYALLVFAGLLPWQLFSSALSESSNSLIANANLISKVYFPRVLVPIAAITVALVDFLISIGILAGLMVWYQYLPGWQLLTLPLFVLMALLAVLGPGLWFAALNVRYRDVRYVIPFIVQIGLYVSPVGFASSVVPHEWRLIYALNPMVSVIDGFRWAILGGQTNLFWPGFAVSWLVIISFLWLGLKHFRSTEKRFADFV